VLRGVVEEVGLSRVALAFGQRQNAARKAEFKSLHDRRRSSLLRFADQKVNVLGHDHVPDYDKRIAAAHLFQHGEKQVATPRRAEQRLPPITTASDEM
jgi:hypothetical protein